MLTKTKGIVIRCVRYGDASAIVNIYTEDYGLLGFHLPSVFKNKGRIRPSHLQLLNRVELSFLYTPNKNLLSVKDFTCHGYYTGTDFSMQAYYNVMAELLMQILREHEQNKPLFAYLNEVLVPSLSIKTQFWQLPLSMLEVLYHYGCAPNTDFYEEGTLLELKDGVFIRSKASKYTAEPDTSHAIYTMLCKGAAGLPEDGALRHRVIEDIVKYYRWHINENFDLRSREILWQVMKG